MRTKSLLVVVVTIATLFSSCKKGGSGTIETTPPVLKHISGLLKDIVITNLPSPYYHFEYNADSTVSFASYASDFRRYQVDYTAKRISEMTNILTTPQEKVQYFYDNSGKVISVNYLDLSGNVYIKVLLAYDGDKLIKLERRRKLGSDFVVNKILSFSYYNDDNLEEIIDHRPFVAGQQTESTTSTWFDQYDNKINVDGFSLIHNDFFDHLLILPNVQLQRNNPSKEVLNAGDNIYEVNYTYTYNEKNLPLTKNAETIITQGASTGQRIQSSYQYSYY